MQHKTNRFLAMLLAVVMVFSMLPMTALAAEDENNVAEFVDVTPYAEESAAVTAQATESVLAYKAGYYPVEFTLTNPTAADYSVTLEQIDGAAELHYQGTDAVNGTITLSAYTEVSVSGVLAVTDADTQKGDVLVDVVAGGDVLDTVAITVDGLHAISYTFDTDAEGWTGPMMSYTDRGSIYIGINGGSDGAASVVISGDELVLTTGNLYRLDFMLKGAKVFAQNMAARVMVCDYDADGNALSHPYSLNQQCLLDGTEQNFSCYFVANSLNDENYAYSKLSFRARDDAGDYTYRQQLEIDDVLLVDAGAAEAIEVPNGDFETLSGDGFSASTQGFTHWTTTTAAGQGTTTKCGTNPTTGSGWVNETGGRYIEAYEGEEMMALFNAGSFVKYNSTSFTTEDQIVINAWIRYVQWRNMGVPTFTLHVSETDNAGNSTDRTIGTTIFCYGDWMNVQGVYVKPASVARFNIGVNVTGTEYVGTFVDHVTMHKVTDANAITAEDIAAADPIEIYGSDVGTPEEPVDVDYKAAYYDFDSDLEGWSGSVAKYNEADQSLFNEVNNGTGSSTAATATSRDELRLTEGNLYRLTFNAKGNKTFTEESAVQVMVCDYDANGNALSQPYSLNQAFLLNTTDIQEYTCYFVANVLNDENYHHSKLAFTSRIDNWAVCLRDQVRIYDVLLVDAGKAEAIEVSNGDFETPSGDSTQLFADWYGTGAIAKGSVQGGGQGNGTMPVAFDGEMMAFKGRGQQYQNTVGLNTSDVVVVNAWFNHIGWRGAYIPTYSLYMTEYDSTGTTELSSTTIATGTHANTNTWFNLSGIYSKSDAADNFRIGVMATNSDPGADGTGSLWSCYADHVTVYKATAVASITSEQIAAAEKIPGFSYDLPEGPAAPEMPEMPGMAAPGVTELEKPHVHTEGEVVVENVVAATCTTAGSYDNVIYCTGCGEEISRETVAVDALEHDFSVFVETVEPTFDAEGYTTYKCSGCEETENRDFTAAKTYVAKIGDAEFETLQAAFNAVQDGETITLLSDVAITADDAGYSDGTYVDGVRYTGDKSFIVDFAGYTLTDDGCVNDYLVYLNNKGEKASEITFRNGTVVSKNGCWATVCVNSSVATQAIVLNLEGMNVTNSNDASYSGNVAVRARNMATVNVKAGTIVTSDGASYGVAANTSDAVVNINNGAQVIQKNSGETSGNSVFTAVGGKGTVNIYDGAIITSDMYGVHTMTTGTPVINVYGGTITAPVALKASTNGGTGELATINVTGGTINGTLENYTDNGKIVVSGGTFSAAVAEKYCAEGYVPVENADGTYGVAEANYVAEVNGVGYETLAEAFAAVADGQTVTLLSDVVIDSETYTIPDGVSVTLDMNGKKLTVTDNKASDVNYELFYIYGGLTVTGNGTIELTSTSNDTEWKKLSAIFHNRGGVLTIENGTFTHTGGTCMAFVVDNSGNHYGDATTNIVDGTLTSSYTAIRNRMEQNSHGASGTAYLNISGGAITGSTSAIWAQAASTSTTAPATGEINITGGNVGVVNTARSDGAVCKTTISGGTVEAVKAEVGELTVTKDGTVGTVTILDASGNAVDAVQNANGTYGVLPNAEVVDLGRLTIDEYGIYTGKDLVEGTEPIDLQIAMEFIAKDSAEEAAANAFGDYTTDFYITLDGMAGDSFIADEDCYLAGNYGTFGWIMVPLEGMVIENGKVYPVITSVGLNFTYEAICSDVQLFKCGIHLSDAVLAANPDLSVTLELGLSESFEAAQAADSFITVDEPYIYDAEDFKTFVAEVNGEKFTSLADAVTAAQSGETVTLLADTDEAVTVSKVLTIVKNGFDATGVTVVEGYAKLLDLDGNYVIGAKPTATVNDLGPMTIPASDYQIYDGKLQNATEDMPLSFVMQFVADQTADDMTTSPYADWYADFVITFEGLENDSFNPEGCYLAGFYGETEYDGELTWNGMWVKIPVDGILTSIEEGVRYPVMLGVGMGQKYDYICAGVQAFSCAMYLPEHILEANPNLKVKLELAMVDDSKGESAAYEALLESENQNVYTVEDHTYVAEDFVDNFVAKIGSKMFATLQDAVDAAQAGETITLLTDVETEALTVAADKNIILDLAGKTVSGTSSESSSYALITNKGTLTVKDSVGNGKISYVYTGASSNYSFAWGNYTILNSGNLTVESGTVENATGAISGHMFSAIDNHSGGTVTINGGTVSCPNYVAIRQFAGSSTAENVVEINDGTVTGKFTLWPQNANEKDDTKATLTINGGTIEGSSTPLYIGEPLAPTFAITKADTVTLAAPEDYEWVNGTLTAKNYVAQVGEDKFETLSEALAAAQDGETITLLADVTVSDIIVIDNAITLNGNSKTITSTAARAINVDTTGEVTIQNLTIVGNTGCERGVNIINQAGITNLNNVTVSDVSHYAVHIATSAGAAKLNVTDSNLTGYGAVVVYGAGSETTVTDSALVGINTYADNGANSFATVIAGVDNCTIHVTGGSITASTADGNAPMAAVGSHAGTQAVIVLDTELLVEGAATYASVDAASVELSVRAEYADELAAEGYTTEAADVEGMVNVTGAFVAKVGEDTYETVAEALAAAKAIGGTVVMVADSDETGALILIYSGVTLDLAGNKLTAENVIGFSGSQVKDSSTDKIGRLVADQNAVVLSSANAEVPVWTGDSYLFATIKDQQQIISNNVDVDGTYKFAFRPSFGSTVNSLLANGTAAAGLEIGLRVYWTEMDGVDGFKTFVITDDFAKQIYGDGKVVQLTLKGLSEFENVRYELVILSDATNVDWTGEEWTVK